MSDLEWDYMRNTLNTDLVHLMAENVCTMCKKGISKMCVLLTYVFFCFFFIKFYLVFTKQQRKTYIVCAPIRKPLAGFIQLSRTQIETFPYLLSQWQRFYHTGSYQK